MADSTYHFRSAMSGFHKGDVTAYIEKVAAEHRSELLECEKTISALREENRSLNQQLNLLMMSTPVVEKTPAVEPTPVVPVAEPEATPTQAEAASPDAEELMVLELQAYRRAEAVERNANKRVRKIYQQVEDVCAEARGQFESTDSAVRQTIEAMLEQTKSLEAAYQALAEALEASRDKIAVMDDLLLDGDEIE